MRCQRVGAVVCAACLEAVEWVEEPICTQCGQSVKQAGICGRCQKRPLALSIRAALQFGGSLPDIIHQFKYYRAFGLATPLADLMAHGWPRWAMPATLVVPIPLHPQRQKERGYNQSALLARHFAAQIQLPVAAGVLRRVRQTQVQARLNAQERLHNVQGAFEADMRPVQGQQILLVDDVCTTGATLHAAAQALLAAGAHSVNAYCLARAG